MIAFIRRWTCLGIGLLALWAVLPARADSPGSITVVGVGTAKAMPTVVEIAATVSGDGELAADANVKFTDTKTKAIAALNALNIANLSIESDGASIEQTVDAATQMRIMQGMGGGATPKQRVEVAEQVRLVIKDADKVGADKLVQTIVQILDACHDSGLQIGAPQAQSIYQLQLRMQNGSQDTLVTFKIPEVTDLRNQAYQQAIADAKAKANVIAQFAGVRLGGVVAVQEEPYGQAEPYNPQAEATSGKVSQKLAEIPVTVHLSVKFEIVK